MTGSFARRLSRTLPPALLVGTAIMVLLFVEGLYLWAQCWLDSPELVEATSRQFLHMRDSIAGLMMAVYGVFRVAAFHPLFRPKYRAWLEQTPWTSRSPLPLGPIHLLWQDALVLGVVLLTLHGTPLGRVGVLGAFFLAYTGVLGASFWITGPTWMGYVVLFSLGLAIRLASCPFAALGTLAVAYGLALVGLRMALARFPWLESKVWDSASGQVIGKSDPQRKSLIGWPYGQLIDASPEVTIRRRDGILSPILAAWWVYALASNIIEVQERGQLPGLVFFLVTVFAFGIRLLAYTGACRPPISLCGRIATGFWVIPGYDYVLLAPLCTLLMALVGLGAAMLAGPAYGVILYPLATAAVLIVALNMGPSLEKWRLTGHYRMTPWGVSDPQQARL